MERSNYKNYEGRTELSKKEFLELLEAGETDFSSCFLPEIGEVKNRSFSGVCFDNSYLADIRAAGCDFTGASFVGASVYGDFSRCDFSNASFEAGHISSTFSLCQFFHTSFERAHFRGRYFFLSKFRAVLMDGAAFDGTWCKMCSVIEPCIGTISYTQGGATEEEVEIAKASFFKELRIS